MEWFEILIVALPIAVLIIAGLWNGWASLKRLIREIGEAFLELADAIEDDSISRIELRQILDKFAKIVSTIRELMAKDIKSSAHIVAGSGAFLAWFLGLFKGKEEGLAPPKSFGKITGHELWWNILRPIFGKEAYISIGDRDYELTSVEECQRFLRYYKDKHPYTSDEYDCEDFAWMQRAEALKWMHGKFVWGYVEASGLDDNYKFPPHGFNFIVNQERRVYICDELEVAAPKDEFVEAYELKTYLAKA